MIKEISNVNLLNPNCKESSTQAEVEDGSQLFIRTYHL